MSSPSTALGSAFNATALFQNGALAIEFHRELNPHVQAHWMRLLDSIKNPTLFQHPAWHLAFLESRYNAAQHGQPLFACVSENSQPKALIPLLMRKTRQHGLPVNLVELMFATDMGVRDFPVADDANGGALLQTVLYRALPDAGLKWDIAALPDLVLHSTADRAFQQISTRNKSSVYHHDSNRLRCGDDKSQPFANVSKSHVKKTRRKRKNFEALGSLEFELLTDPATLPPALDLFVELENAGWKGSGGERTSLYHDQPQKQFYESLATNSAPLLNGCVAILRLNNKPVAINVCNRVGDTLWMLKITYEDALQEYSPGNLILLFLLERFAGDPAIKYISFITGGEWTLRWGPERQLVMTCSIFNKTPIGLASGVIEHSRQQLRRIKHHLQRTRTDASNHDADREESQ